MECPHCTRNISATAIRCRYCRRPVNGYARDWAKETLWPSLTKAARAAGRFLKKGRSPAACPWSYADAILITVFLWLFITNDPFHISSGVFKFIRSTFPTFVKDPRFLNYLNIYIGTMIFKAVALVIVIVMTKVRGAEIMKTVFSRGNVSELWWKLYLPLYTIACLVLRDISSLNPLLPNLPFDSVFPEAKLVGNIVVMFSVIVIAPVVEEMIFRGFLYPAFNRYMGMHPAVFITAALFTLAHYPQISDDVVFMGTLFSLSLIITYARALTGSTIFAILLHLIYNLMYVAVGVVNYFILKY